MTRVYAIGGTWYGEYRNINGKRCTIIFDNQNDAYQWLYNRDRI